MKPLSKKPRLRQHLDFQSTIVDGEQFVVVIDSLGITPAPVMLSPVSMAILSRLNGEHSLQQILDEGSPFGLTEELLLNFVDQLSTNHLIENEKTADLEQKLFNKFKDSPLRPAAHAGKVYSDDATELANSIDTYLTNTKDAVASDKLADNITALICPHIDYRRGWQSYASAYHAMCHANDPDVIFVIGTSHQRGSGQSLFHLTDKDFEIPLGVLESEKDVVRDLAKRYDQTKSFADEYLHRSEHSLELQLPFIFHCYRNSKVPKIVPILVSSFHHLFDTGKYPIEIPEVEDFVMALAEMLKSLRNSNVNAMLYAGVDLSHMGMSFGDSQRLNDQTIAEIERRDRLLLECVLEKGDSALFDHMAEDRDQRRICGYPSMYTMLASIKRAGINTTGELIEYRQAVDHQSDCLVSFASAYLREV